MPDRSLELVQGTVDVLILKAASWGPVHGFAISAWIRDRTDGTLGLQDAALYQALHRLEKRGLLDSEWGPSDNNRRAKFYRLTKAGQGELRERTARLRRYVSAVFDVLDATKAVAR